MKGIILEMLGSLGWYLTARTTLSAFIRTTFYRVSSLLRFLSLMKAASITVLLYCPIGGNLMELCLYMHLELL